MSAIQCWPQELVQPVTWRRICWSKPGRRSSSLADEPLVEALGLGDGELAELGAGAGDGAAPEGRDVDLEAERVELDDERGGLRGRAR